MNTVVPAAERTAGLSDASSIAPHPREASAGRLPTGWTDDREALLRQLWSQGLSASQIAAELGGISRNSVIGKVHRLKLPGRPHPGDLSATSYALGKKRVRKSRIRQIKPWVQEQPSTETLTTDLPAQTMGVSMETRPETACSIMELAAGKCRWPLWGFREAPGLYCGGRAVDGHPYCGFHCRMAYQPVQARRGRPYVTRGEAA